MPDALGQPLLLLQPVEVSAIDGEPAPLLNPRQHIHTDRADEVRSVFTLQGLTCAACAGAIESALATVPGVLSAEVNAASRRLQVVWDPQRTQVSQLVAAVHQAGYEALPIQGEDLQAAQHVAARRTLWRLFVAGFCMMQVMMLTAPTYFAGPGDIAPDLLALLRWSAWVLSLPVLLFSTGPFFSGAWAALRWRHVSMDLPVALGVAITFVAGTGSTFDPQGPFGADAYLDSMTMFVALLLSVRWLEQRARARSTEALDALMQRVPDYAERLDDDGMAQTVPVAQLCIGDRVSVAVGQAFPGDGIVLDGSTQVDESLLTGESHPVERGQNDTVVGGSINLGTPVVVRLRQVGQGTRYQQIVDLVQRALTERPALVRAADRLAGPFLYGVLILAALATVVWYFLDPARALMVGVSVLIVTCPCALSLAAPAALLSATGALARRGVLVQRLDAFEALARADVACFDKTGTLTQDRLALSQTFYDGYADHGEVLARAASLAAHSRHPLSVALVQALPPAQRRWSGLSEVAGQGVEAFDEQGRCWRLGAPGWVGVSVGQSARPMTACATLDTMPPRWVGFEFDEALRPDARSTLRDLRLQGVAVQMLSGDAPTGVQAVARQLGIAHAQSSATPEDKLAALSDLQAHGHVVMMVGDGLNDGPVLARADVSFALSHGSALAQQRSDFIVLGSRLAELPLTRALALRTMRVVRQNLTWAVIYNLLCIPLALAGLLPPWAAGGGMALSSLVVVLNALRLGRA